MKVTYTFTDEEREELLTFQNAFNYQVALCDMGNYLRTISDKGDSDNLVKASDIYEYLFAVMAENNLNRELVGF